MIIHNPEITGSLIFPRTDGTKVVLRISSEGVLETIEFDATGSETGNIPASNLSGSFTGSFQGDGSQLTGVAASELNIDLFTAGTIAGDDELLFSDTDDSGNEKRGTFKSGLDSLSVISGSSQVDVEQTTNFTAFSSSIASTFAGLSSDFDDLVDNPFTQSASQVTITKDLIPSNLNIDLGSPSSPFKDLYLSSASLYVDGTQVLSSNATELTLTTDANQSLKLVETGADTVQIQTENGDITLTSSGTGNIELDAPIQIVAGNQILSSDGNAIAFGEDLDITGNITISGTVDGVDVASLNSSFNTLNGKTLVSGSSQVVLESADKTGFTGASSITTLGTITSGVWQGTIIDSQYLDADPLPAGTISGSVQVDLTQTTNYVSGIKTRLNAEQVLSGSTHSGDQTFSDNVTVTGNLTVNGTTTTVNSNTVNIGDNILVLNSDEAGTPSQNGGIEVERGTSTNASLIWDEGSDVWKAGLSSSEVELVTISGTQTLTNKTITASQVTEISNLTEAEGAQLENIDSVTISNTQWGYVGALDQGLTTSSTVQFGKVGVGGASDATYELKVTGDIGATGDVVAYVSSDERLKDSIELISDPIGKVQSLKGVTWEWNENASEAAKQSPNVGVIAQDVEKVLPQLVHDRDNGFKGVDYAKLTGLLIEAVKEQQKQIDELKSKLG